MSSRYPQRPSSWSSKSSKVSKSVTVSSRSRHHGYESETSASVQSKTSDNSEISTQETQSEIASGSSAILSCKPEPAIEMQRHAKITQSCSNYSGNSEYAMVPMQSVVTANYTAPITPIISSLPTAEVRISS